jgi:hypothetical protein
MNAILSCFEEHATKAICTQMFGKFEVISPKDKELFKNDSFIDISSYDHDMMIYENSLSHSVWESCIKGVDKFNFNFSDHVPLSVDDSSQGKILGLPAMTMSYSSEEISSESSEEIRRHEIYQE